jgi:RNA polymerase sigma-70 factor (ECF subfamily)
MISLTKGIRSRKKDARGPRRGSATASETLAAQHGKTPGRNSKDPKANVEDTLLIGVAKGDEAAFRRLYDMYVDRLFVFCRKMMGDGDAAKDALQNAFIRIYERADTYSPSTNPTAWIYRLTRNVCIDMIRAAKDHDNLEDVKLPAQEPRQRDVALQEALSEEIEALPQIYREAIILRDIQGHSYKEIAEIVDAPLSTVKFRIFKARDVLRDRLRLLLNSDSIE